jgi:hypothetical protein
MSQEKKMEEIVKELLLVVARIEEEVNRLYLELV